MFIKDTNAPSAVDGNLPDNLEQLKASIQLAADDEVFYIHRRPDGHIVPCLLLNDTFCYACADGEEVNWDQVVRLRDKIRAGGWPEGIRWAQEEGREHANLLPIGPVQANMNNWDKKNTRITELEKALQDAYYAMRHGKPEDQWYQDVIKKIAPLL